MTDELVQLAAERVQDSMDEILANFKSSARITVLVRTPGRPTADFCMTDDDLDEVIMMVHRRKSGRPLADAPAGWQSIETAPCDGTRILFINRMYDDICLGYYKNGHIWTGNIVFEPSAIPREWKDVADFWMPAPAMPTSKIDRGKS